MTALDPTGLDTAARTLGQWLYAADLTEAARYTVAQAVIDAYLGAADDQPVGTRHLLTLPYDRPPNGLTANGSHGNYHAKAADTKRVRAAVAQLATDAGIRPCAHLAVWLYWAPGTRHRRDADNLWPLLKVCCDALAKGPRRDWVGLDLVPDDTPQYMTKHAPRILGPDETNDRGLWLIVDALDTAPGVPARTCPQPQGDHSPNAGARPATTTTPPRPAVPRVVTPAKPAKPLTDEMRGR